MLLPPDDESLALAAARLRDGQLVAFPTETVYGLGARADDSAAVARIYAAKGRPSQNPSIVHVLDADAAFALAREIPPAARALAESYWPGPLTLVLPVRAGVVAPEVTARGDTVAVRVPSHPVARALLEVVALPLAAPSANRSTSTSPTTAAHVAKNFTATLAIIDGGPTGFGIESTIVDVTTEPARILRRGSIRLDALASVVPIIDVGEAIVDRAAMQRAPGMQARHYAPRAPLELVPRAHASVRVLELAAERRVGWITCSGELSRGAASHPNVVLAALSSSVDDYERCLYAALHALDDAGVERIVVDEVPVDKLFDAVRDRLRRAAHPSDDA